MVDNLCMTYDGNRLVSVRDDASRHSYAGATDFDGVPQQEYALTYNDAGSLTSDAGRKIANIDYDLLNNPIRIQFTDGNVTKYIYSATGEKLRVIYQTAVPNISVPIGSTKELSPSEILYTDSIDYLLGGALTLKNGRIDKYQFDEGYCQAERYTSTQDEFTFCYYDLDHLGNVRQVTEDDGDTGWVTQKNDYYPFGAQFCDGSASTNAVQSHKFNGKELDLMHGLNTYDYGARQYNPVTGRWDRMDPLCEKYYGVSSYAYCHNNPIMLVDPDGMDDYYNEEGKYLGTNKMETDNIYISPEGEYNQLEDGRYVVNTGSRVGLAEADLGAEAFSQIFTNTLKLMDIDSKNLVDNKVQVTVWTETSGGSNITDDYTKHASDKGGALATTDRDHSRGALITAFVFPKGTQERGLLSTRSNVQSLLGDHEYHGHYINNWRHTEGTPDKTYGYQVRHPRWQKTTKAFREYHKSIFTSNGWTF